jgi:hypothetical protein
MGQLSGRYGCDKLRFFTGGIDLYDIFSSHADVGKLAVLIANEIHVIGDRPSVQGRN